MNMLGVQAKHFPKIDLRTVMIRMWWSEIIEAIAFMWDVDLELIRYNNGLMSDTIHFTIDGNLLCTVDLSELLILAMIGKERNGK